MVLTVDALFCLSVADFDKCATWQLAFWIWRMALAIWSIVFGSLYFGLVYLRNTTAWYVALHSISQVLALIAWQVRLETRRKFWGSLEGAAWRHVIRRI